MLFCSAAKQLARMAWEFFAVGVFVSELTATRSTSISSLLYYKYLHN